jgi:uncharacterized membrane protein YfhO
VVTVVGDTGLRASPGRVLRVLRAPERVEVEAETEGEGLLVVCDAYWPGWTATLDGRPVPILRADALVRAVSWPAGRHVLRMEYAPEEVRWGWIVSAVSAVALAAIGLWWPRRALDV